MKIRMRTTSAGPAGVRDYGREYDVPESEARDLIAGHYAVAVNGHQAAGAATAVEVEAKPRRK